MDVEWYAQKGERNMKELEIYEYNGEGYNPTMHFENWRVAFLHYAERFDRIDRLERHLLTEEVFVLMKGKGVLFIGEEAKPVPMEWGKMYNVKQAVWHAIKVTPDAKVLIVENHNTSRDNSEYLPLDPALRSDYPL